MNILPIAVIGGTGKSGQYLVQELLRRGHALRLLHRHPERLGKLSGAIEVIQGDARNEPAIYKLLEGCSAVLSTLGQPAGEPPIFSTATGHVLRAMAQYQIRRYIVTTGLSVDDRADHKSDWVKTAGDWMYAHYPATTADKQAEHELLCTSPLSWTQVRLPRILLTEEQKGITLSLDDCPGQQIHASDLAAFLADQLEDRRYERKAPFIASL